MKPFYHKTLFAAAALLVLRLVFPAEVFAQEKVLSRQTLQNFIKNYRAIIKAFGETANPDETAQVSLGFDEMAGRFFELAYTDSVDFNGIKASYQKLLSLKAPSFDKVFSKYGVNPRGYRSYIVIFTGITICKFEDEIKNQIREMSDRFGDSNENVNSAINAKKKNLRLLQELLHSSDMALVEDNKDRLLELFNQR